MASCLQHLLLALSAATLCSAYPSGPPAFACLNGQPMHQFTEDGITKIYPPYVGQPLYSLTANATEYSPGTTVLVELKKWREEKFEGFIVRAMRAGATTVGSEEGPVVGSIDCWNSQNATMKLMSVYSPSNATNCISHASEKDYEWVRCHWTPPDGNEGPIVFVATAVEDYNKYEHLMTQPLNSSMGMPANVTGEVGRMERLPSLFGCGKTKTCALYPAMCDIRGGCSHGVVMTALEDNRVRFEVFGATDDWVGMGISESREMENMELYWCTYSWETRRVTVKTSYSPKNGVIPVYRPMVKNRAAMVQYNQSSSAIPPQPTQIACTFERPVKDSFRLYKFADPKDVIEDISTDLSEGKYIVLAQGRMIGAESLQMAKHPFRPLKSPMKFKSNSVSLMYFGGVSETVKTHGTLMTICWMLLVVYAIIVARHSRPVYNQKLVLKKDLWFLLHVVFMIVGFVLAAAGVIYMLVRHGGWEDESATHGVIGLIGLGLSLINIVAGMFRPDPEAKYRWVFNRLHRYNGLLSLLFSGIAMWLGATMYGNRPEFRFWAVIVLAVWTGVVLLLMIVFECLRQTKASRTEFEQAVNEKYKLEKLDSGGGEQQEQEEEEEQQQQQQQHRVKGKRLPHVPAAALMACGAALLAVSAAFWAALWLH